MTIPYADEIERMWRRGKAVRRAYAEHLDHLDGRRYVPNCRCDHCAKERADARARHHRRKARKA